MAEYTTLGWQNENGLTNYPFFAPFQINDLLVDASFIQFDNFIPVFTSLLVGEDFMEFTISFDNGEVTARYQKTDFYSGIKNLRMYDSGGDRYLGCLTIGEGANTAWGSYVGEQLNTTLPFIPTTVRSIPLNDAVYRLDNSYGSLVLGANQDTADSFTEIGGIVYQTSAGVNTIFYNTSTSPASITFNAVANAVVPTNSKIHPLKQINLTKPLNNNITLSGNDIVKFKSISNQNLSIYVVGQASANTSSLALTTLSA